MAKTYPFPTVEEAERVIAHLLSYPDHCESTLDNVRHIMQWLTFERPTEKALATHCRILRRPVPDGIRPDVAYVPTTRHRTTMIVEGVLKGYLEWIKANHPETGDDVDPDAELYIDPDPDVEPYIDPEPGEHQVVLDAINGCNSGEDE